MTIIGYKPSIMLPWYRSHNDTSFTNVTEPSAIPRLLGEPGPLRVLVYIGPILMGLGAFSMMVSIVLFCEIKDRYFNNIVPKTVHEQRQKVDMYDKIIDEFRKNYFRGIEVPLKAISRRRSKGRFSFSLSRSGSLVSFGRRLSHDFQKRKRERKASRESQTERVTSHKHKRSSLRRVLDTDSWMKTSSLPNIRHKESPHCVFEIGECPCMAQTRTSQSCGPTLDKLQITDSANGVDNPAYRDSPPGKRLHRPLTKHASLETHENNKYLTTVIVHRESNTDAELERPASYLPELRCSSNREDTHSNHYSSQCSVIDIEKDIEMLPRFHVDNETTEIIPSSLTSLRPIPPIEDQNAAANEHREECTCGTDYYCKQHALGMDSGGSSLSLSWENIPSEWNDARRNTEPIVVYKRSPTNIPQTCMSDGTGSVQRTLSELSEHQIGENLADTQQFDIGLKPEPSFSGDMAQKRRRSFIAAPFRTKINVFKSDTNLTKAGKYSLLRPNQCDGADSISMESLNLTEDMLKNFEMTETAHI